MFHVERLESYRAIQLIFFSLVLRDKSLKEAIRNNGGEIKKKEKNKAVAYIQIETPEESGEEIQRRIFAWKVFSELRQNAAHAGFTHSPVDSCS